MVTFYEFGLHHDVTRAIQEMGFEEATPIQESVIPAVLQGKDIIGQAQTGTGKTSAFGIPLIEKADTEHDQIQGVILTPTRELAVQVAEELNKIGQFKGIRSLPIYGGQDINRQIKALKKRPQYIVATPGRLMDHMRRRTIRTDAIHTIVLDEADEMLNMGFIEDIEMILKDMPAERQTLLFSATMPKTIQSIAQRYMNQPELIKTKSKEITVSNITQQYLEVQEKQKFEVLTRLLDIDDPKLAIIFGRTKRRVDELSEALEKRGYEAEGIHGDLTQSKRESVLRKFKEGSIEILVATDVAARGLDISGVSHVYNFDIPQDSESYVHRIGRTGRAGKTGLAVTFVTPREMGHLRIIEETTKRKIERRTIPTYTEAIQGKQRLTVEKLLEIVKEDAYQSYEVVAKELLQDNGSVTLLAAALKLLTNEPSNVPVKLSEEAPLRIKRAKRPAEKPRNSRNYRNDDRKDRNDRSDRSKSKNYRGKQQRTTSRKKTSSKEK